MAESQSIDPAEIYDLSLYVILERNGYIFGADGCDYVIVHAGDVIMRDCHKQRVEARFMEVVGVND